MGQLIDDLLPLARITRAEPRLGPVALSEIARRIADELRQREPQRVVDFVIADAVAATGDANLLAIALSNLLENAWKFTAKKPVARIEFGVTQTGEDRIYYVKDMAPVSTWLT